jgi:hypothetical protein
LVRALEPQHFRRREFDPQGALDQVPPEDAPIFDAKQANSFGQTGGGALKRLVNNRGRLLLKCPTYEKHAADDQGLKANDRTKPAGAPCNPRR